MIQFASVGHDGDLRLRVNHPPGTRLRVVIEAVSDPEAGTAIGDGPGQTGSGESSAFVREILGAPAEDVWNDL